MRDEDLEDEKSLRDRKDKAIAFYQRHLIAGYTHGQIKRMSGIHELMLTNPELIVCHEQALSLIKEHYDRKREENYSLVASSFWRIFRIAKRRGDLSEQRRVLSDISKIMGLHTQTIEHSVSDRPLKDINASELKKLLEKMNSAT